MSRRFYDRTDAGKRLAQALEDLRGSSTTVFGLARGGVVVASALAQELGLPLHALVVAKIGAPNNPELALGAVSETGEQWFDPAIIKATGASDDFLLTARARHIAEAKERRMAYGGSGPILPRGTGVLIVDDGIATGATALVAVRSIRHLGASDVILAAPVASQAAVLLLQPEVERLTVLLTPATFDAVGLHYDRFAQVTDTEVMRCLVRAGESGTQVWPDRGR